MKVYCHAPQVPPALEPLLDVAYNFWWTSDSGAKAIFERLGKGLWRSVAHNPVLLLRQLSRHELEAAAADADLVTRIGAVRDRMVRELEEGGRFRVVPTRAGASDFSIEHSPLAAYFSAEFGIHESLPTYSGGLGVLAGDHIRSCSDLDLPFVGIGLLYRFGYFHQRFSLDDWQVEQYEPIGFHNLPLKLIEHDDGAPLYITIQLPDRDMRAQVWLAQVGRCALFLLDTYVRDNWPSDREVTARLYDANRETRLLQEIVLGVGGVRVLEALHIAPHRFHMNEGHSAFLVLERAAQLMRVKNLSFEEARLITRESNVFTTHTPVAAGHEVFLRPLMEKYFRSQLGKMKLEEEEFFDVGHRLGTPKDGSFEMTSLAIRFSKSINGVSRLHGEVARAQWQCMWPEREVAQVPIGHVTNGIHTGTWIGPEMRALFNRALGDDWLKRVTDEAMWRRIDEIPDEEIWEAHQAQRKRLVEFVARRAQLQMINRNADRFTLQRKINELLPNALTIGFARRFAGYKRANLLLRHPDRLAPILEAVDRPVQFVFAGKAHPADDEGKRILQEVSRAAMEAPYYGRFAVIEDYDMHVARRLVQGVDVWLNNPRPPQEASGTSGMKACPNGSLTISTNDGWWAEAMGDEHGWTIGRGAAELATADMDEEDNSALLDVLESKVIPLFFDRDEKGLPRQWIRRMRESIKRVTPYFTTARMVREYAERFYTH